MNAANVLMNKVHLVGSGYAEMPHDGRRFRFHIERYRHDDGSEWGVITSMEEIPDVGEYLWIPSHGVETADEVQHLTDEYRYEEENPTDEKVDWDARRRQRKGEMLDNYDELRDARAKVIERNPRTLRRR